uniref:Uncharacterized protein n=1 Tax=Chromera velia CCMP2878 TaxID=1169474 RepID=A0A0G4GW17_9ALVE|eukprot:Cvel_23631.t1-p1 / transcript=Cvel_23631.t1 / gene=Cvel_23631 / organism=Chromera_velia_CCMP2878 / gene_product=hypothetical protein / transcript_product=hypothetical protein / location=Cvel_scaffold2457:3197-4171(+) / protein_length=325 / sequence_SO=supercontig / SO=protein_coding / is_pseudo=false
MASRSPRKGDVKEEGGPLSMIMTGLRRLGPLGSAGRKQNGEEEGDGFLLSCKDRHGKGRVPLHLQSKAGGSPGRGHNLPYPEDLGDGGKFLLVGRDENRKGRVPVHNQRHDRAETAPPSSHPVSEGEERGFLFSCGERRLAGRTPVHVHNKKELSGEISPHADAGVRTHHVLFTHGERRLKGRLGQEGGGVCGEASPAAGASDQKGGLKFHCSSGERRIRGRVPLQEEGEGEDHSSCYSTPCLDDKGDRFLLPCRGSEPSRTGRVPPCVQRQRRPMQRGDTDTSTQVPLDEQTEVSFHQPTLSSESEIHQPKSKPTTDLCRATQV